MAQSLTHHVYKVNQLQRYEADAAKSINISLYQLMKRAGVAVFEKIQQKYADVSRILIVCGKGNNGGDGYVIARLAVKAKLEVQVVVNTQRENIQGDAKQALTELENTIIENNACKVIFASSSPLAKNYVENYDGELIIDCLFGIGFKGSLLPADEMLIASINRALCYRVSVDVPSGLDANVATAGSVAIIADITVTLIAYKQGLLTGQAANYVGELYLASLGVNNALAGLTATQCFYQSKITLPQLPRRIANSHKGSIGTLITVGGNEGYAGAIRLCSEAALRTGSALVGVCCHKNATASLQSRPELMAIANSAQSLMTNKLLAKMKAVVIGPGLGQDEWAKQLFESILLLPAIKVLDADALQLLAKHPKQQDWILTPHPGEAAALLSCSVADIEADRYSAVATIANTYGGICVLKGAGTLISDGHSIWVNNTGNAGMASGGMGDVLSGIIGSLAMQMPNLLDAARLGVYIHGRAADIIAQENGMIGMLASDLFPKIQQLVNNCDL